MHLHVLQHESFESPANIIGWAQDEGAAITATSFYRPDWILPATSDIDMLVVMGGPMSVNDEAVYPWLVEEKKFIDACIKADKKILGICLGSQLAASVLGARVYKNPEKEIGWFDIYKTAQQHPVFAHLPQTMTMFHWHGETFDLPDGAIHLASSKACQHQAFIWNNQVLGLQFHPEVSVAHVEEFLAAGGEELKDYGDYVQTARKIRAGMHHAAPMEEALVDMLSAFIAPN